MQDTDYKTWVLILALAVGGTVQIAKSIRPTPLRQTADVSASFGEADDEPYSVGDEANPVRAERVNPQAEVAVGPAQMSKFLAQAAAPAPTQAGTFADKDKGDDKPKKDEVKCVKKVDPATGKEKEVCKKKKKKKKAAATTEDAQATTPVKAKPSDDKSDSAAIQWGVGNVVATNQLNVTNGQADTAFESLAYWEKILLDHPDLDETKRFIDHFQRNLVASDVFYQITKEMMADSRSDMKLLGVMCASQSPSISSFQLLADLTQTEASGSSARSQADAALARYTDISSLTVLAGVMRANASTYSVTLAVQKLSVAANRYLTASTTTTTKDPTTGASTTTKGNTTAARNKTYFTKFVTILQTLAKSTDATLKATASGTLTNLQSLLNQTGGGTSGSPSTAVAQS